MNLGYGLRLEQTQKLIMTPELRLAIRILQLSSLELSDYVNQMIMDNPLIELKEEEPGDAKLKKDVQVDWEKFMREIRESFSHNQPREVKEDIPYENMISRDISLTEYLLSQLGLLSLDERKRRAARYLIGNIDSVGYLTVSMEQAQKDLNMPAEEIEELVALIQTFEPPGICARSLSECLLLQLKVRGILTDELQGIVTNHLQNIAEGRLNRVAQSMGIPVTRVQELADTIKTLNPKPGASYGGRDGIGYIIPDVLIERVDGEYVIQVNDTYTPRLTINKTYSSILNKSSEADEETRDFVETKLNQAVWLIKSIEQRKSTIYQVTEALVAMQRAFFDHGIKHLKPLTLKQVAEKLGIHESTVSRATSNKYVQTPHGIFEFKYFFTTGLETEGGDTASSKSIKHLLQEIIKEEDSRRPYSDQKLANILRTKGIVIARRTVTKYREELRILNTGQRRRYS